MEHSAEYRIFNVTVNVANTTGEGETLKGTIAFDCDPDQYGNGFSMYIKGLGEPFGGQGYDIRYDKDFRKEHMMEYIVSFYANRYDGKPYEYGTHWKLMGIRVSERDEDFDD